MFKCHIFDIGEIMEKPRKNLFMIPISLAMFVFINCSTSRISKPGWASTERFDREYQMHISGALDEVFPLLCPVREYEWLNGWKCTMLFSKTGFAEKGAMFYTSSGFPFYKKLNFYITEYDPNRRICFLIVINSVGTILFSIDLIPNKADSTTLIWHYVVTSHSKIGERLLKTELTPEKFTKDLENKEQDLEYFIKHHSMRNKNRK
jgi:ribosome modulation factor